MTNSIDATDLKYQKDKEFPPDKESLWLFPEDHDGWVKAHNAIRGEMKVIEDCLTAMQSRADKTTTLDHWEIDALKRVFDAHCDFVHRHHANEDDIVTPEMAKRINLPSKLTDDHVGIVKTLDSMQSTINALKPTDERKANMGALLKVWRPYSETMKEHLQEEEDIALPLLRAYFKPEEYGVMVQEILKRETKLMMGGLIFYMGRDRFRNEFMTENGIPFFVWFLEFSGNLKMYDAQVVAPANAIKSGVEPVLKRGGLGSLLGC